MTLTCNCGFRREISVTATITNDTRFTCACCTADIERQRKETLLEEKVRCRVKARVAAEEKVLAIDERKSKVPAAKSERRVAEPRAGRRLGKALRFVRARLEKLHDSE
jgi:hypothetical protein